MKANSLPPLDLVKSRLNYDPETGEFTWASRKNSLSRIQVGDTAGRITSSGYQTIKLDGTEFPAHRLAWYIMTGDDPALTVDHSNRIKSDNRWINLRLATHGQQQCNRKINGVKTSRYGKNKYCATIKINGKNFQSKGFATHEEARAVYLILANHFFGDFATEPIANEFWMALSYEQQSDLRNAAEQAKVNIERMIPKSDEDDGLAPVPA